MKKKDNTPGDLISREALKEKVNAFYDKLFVGCVSSDLIAYAKGVDGIIDTAPTLEQEVYITGTDYDFYIKGYKEGRKDFERPHGEWIKWNFKTFGAFGDWEYKCSKCEKVYGGEYNFCPNCGADMRKNEKKVQTPSCLTDPDRHAELLERYKEGGAE